MNPFLSAIEPSHYKEQWNREIYTSVQKSVHLSMFRVKLHFERL